MSTDVSAGDRNLDGQSTPAARVEHLSEAERAEKGKAARAEVPRSAHADWKPPADRPSPVALLEEQAKTRVPELVPIRYGRMLVSPFTFYRGAAYLMASDLSGQPRTSLQTQLCGDAHLSNFGAFAAPDRRLVFSINDFDETHPGPFEWDVKRLAASFAVAGRDRGFDDKSGRRSTSPSGAPTGRRSTGTPACATSTSGTRASTSRTCSPSCGEVRDREGAQASTGEPGEDADQGQPEGIQQADRDRGRRAADRG